MGFLEGSNEGVLTGTTQADILAVPAASTRRLVKNVKFTNRDTIAHTIVCKKDVSGTLYELFREVLQPSEYFVYDSVVVNDTVNKKLVAVMLANHVTTAPCFDVVYADATGT